MSAAAGAHGAVPAPSSVGQPATQPAFAPLRYALGQWTCVAGPGIVLLADLDPDGPIALACWAAVERGVGASGLLGVIVREGLRNVPGFAIGSTSGDGVSVVVSGTATAVVTAPDAAEPEYLDATARSADPSLWREQRFPTGTAVRLVAAGVDEPRGVGIAGGASLRPLLGGVVPAGIVVIATPDGGPVSLAKGDPAGTGGADIAVANNAGGGRVAPAPDVRQPWPIPSGATAGPAAASAPTDADVAPAPPVPGEPDGRAPTADAGEPVDPAEQIARNFDHLFGATGHVPDVALLGSAPVSTADTAHDPVETGVDPADAEDAPVKLRADPAGADQPDGPGADQPPVASMPDGPVDGNRAPAVVPPATPNASAGSGLIESLPWLLPTDYALDQAPPAAPPVEPPVPPPTPAAPRAVEERISSNTDVYAIDPNDAIASVSPHYGAAAARPALAPPVPAPPPVPPVLPAAPPSAHPPALGAPPVGEPPHVAPTVLAVVCPNGHLGPPYAGVCRVCGAPVPLQDPFMTPRPVLGTLTLSTGDMVPLDRDIVLGRSPSSAADADPHERPHVVQLASPNNDISRNHLRVGIEDWHVLVTDLGSTNGTIVTLPGQQPVRLRSHDAFTIVPGTVINIADEVFARFEVPQAGQS